MVYAAGAKALSRSSNFFVVYVENTERAAARHNGCSCSLRQRLEITGNCAMVSYYQALCTNVQTGQDHVPEKENHEDD